MKKATAIKIAAMTAVVIGMTFAFSAAPAAAQEEILLAMLTKTDSLDEIGIAYKEKKVALTATTKKIESEGIVNRMVQEVGSKVDEAASVDGWPGKLLGYIPYEIMTGDYGGLFMKLAF